MVALFRSLTVAHILIALAGFGLWYQTPHVLTCGLPVAYVPPVPDLRSPQLNEPAMDPALVADMPVLFVPQLEQ